MVGRTSSSVGVGVDLRVFTRRTRDTIGVDETVNGTPSVFDDVALRCEF